MRRLSTYIFKWIQWAFKWGVIFFALGFVFTLTYLFPDLFTIPGLSQEVSQLIFTLTGFIFVVIGGAILVVKGTE